MAKRLKKNVKKVQIEFLRTVISMVSAAFALVAALAWNTAITEILKKYIQPGSSVLSWVIYALIVTLIAVLVALYLGWISGRIREEEVEVEEAEENNK
jgi:uncharacterized membrane protein YidH (DUF202 family)